MYDDALPATGAGVLLVGGHAVGMPTVIAVAAGLMLFGLFLYRMATRKRRATVRS